MVRSRETNPYQNRNQNTQRILETKRSGTHSSQSSLSSQYSQTQLKQETNHQITGYVDLTISSESSESSTMGSQSRNTQRPTITSIKQDPSGEIVDLVTPTSHSESSDGTDEDLALTRRGTRSSQATVTARASDAQSSDETDEDLPLLRRETRSSQADVQVSTASQATSTSSRSVSQENLNEEPKVSKLTSYKARDGTIQKRYRPGNIMKSLHDIQLIGRTLSLQE